MGRKSKIEAHPQSKIIIKRLAKGEEYSTILLDFPQLTRFDLDYYVKNKLPGLLSKSGDLRAEIEAERGDDTYSEVLKLKDRAVSILAEAQEAGDLKTALMGIREARGCLELMFKAEGRIQERSINVNLQQVSIYASPEWSKVGEALARILGPYPELRQQVAAEFIALERGGK
jgi:hypothetical protein